MNDIYFVKGNGQAPKQATAEDAGFDLIAVGEPRIEGEPIQEGMNLFSSIKFIEYKTDLKISPPKGVFSLLFPRSSISKQNLSLANSVGVIDNGYRGEVLVRFKYVVQPEDIRLISGKFYVQPNLSKIYQEGDKIAQLVFTEKTDVEFKQVETLDATKRGEGGFGSTGK